MKTAVSLCLANDNDEDETCKVFYCIVVNEEGNSRRHTAREKKVKRKDRCDLHVT